MRTPLDLRVIVAATIATLSLSSCGLLGGSPGEDDEGSNAHGLEKTTLHLATMKSTERASFQIAREKGYFKDEGLEVRYVAVASGVDSMNKLSSGESDIVFASYVPFIQAEAKGTYRNKGGIKIVAEASSTAPKNQLIMAMPNSKIDDVHDLAGKKIAVTAPGTATHLFVLAAMKDNGVPYDDATFVSIPFPDMPKQLKAGNVDAAFLTEPFVQIAKKTAGAHGIYDADSGSTTDFPTTGWATTGDFAEENPKTVAAFQRAMQRATHDARTNRTLVDDMVVKYEGVDEKTAKLVTPTTYQSKIDPKRLQRVADLMREFKTYGFVDERIDVSTMIVPSAPLR